MKKLFFIGVIGLVLFEVANVYFIMPMPGSQRMRSIDLAYFLHSYRWWFRGVLWLSILVGNISAYRFNRLLTLGLLAIVAVVTYLFNFQMAADAMFYQPNKLLMVDANANKVKSEKLIVGIAIGEEARAYPIQFIGYHHQVLDKLGDKQIMVTYCTVCRTARIFEPIVNGKVELFRLVGMDHFNAMFEDKTTKSWWRQANGEALIGKLKGVSLPELDAQQMTLKNWLKLYPNSKIMQADSEFKENYEDMVKYESGKGKSKLTKTDSLSWKEKSWVVGIQLNGKSKAFDWNRLKKERVINNKVGSQPIVLVLANDNKSFVAFERNAASQIFSIKNDSLVLGNESFDLKGISSGGTLKLKKIKAYQEFWHSWETFHRDTEKY